MNFRSLLSDFFKKKSAKSAVLMYHRIADVSSDPWELAVSPSNFEEQLKVLKKYKVMTVDNLNENISKNKHTERGLAITFDDGYRDNYLIAKPLLEKYNFAAMFFITTAKIGVQSEFWWDTLQRICFETPQLPLSLTTKTDKEVFWAIVEKENETNRLDLYYKLCELFKNLPAKKHQDWIEYLEKWSGNFTHRSAYFTMNEEELLTLYENSLFSLGAHTATHPFLPNFSENYQEEEIANSLNTLNKLTNKNINYFAYPHGGCDEKTLQILQRLDIRLGFTTHPQCVTGNVEKFKIPRFQIKNWNGNTFEQHLKNWLKN
ncbi:peptidoglycan/xylan/chitin deacetylase (PgdA/CDA1 family) [Pedobacter sp. UYEF25]